VKPIEEQPEHIPIRDDAGALTSALAVRLRDGDASALRQLMELHADRLRLIAEILTGTPDLATEAVQDAFVQIWERRHAIDPQQDLVGLLVVMTRNRALDLLRHERVHERVATSLLSSVSAEQTSHLNDGDRALDMTELWALVRQVLDGLPPRCREIFLLHWEAGLSYAEIEEMLGISNATIRNQMSRAMKHLTQVVDPERFSLWLDRP
jgi:RNA polymerase sigma-70 factor (ECF subfamily)